MAALCGPIARPRLASPFFQPAKASCSRRGLCIRASAVKLPDSFSKARLGWPAS